MPSCGCTWMISPVGDAGRPLRDLGCGTSIADACRANSQKVPAPWPAMVRMPNARAECHSSIAASTLVDLLFPHSTQSWPRREATAIERTDMTFRLKAIRPRRAAGGHQCARDLLPVLTARRRGSRAPTPTPPAIFQRVPSHHEVHTPLSRGPGRWAQAGANVLSRKTIRSSQY